MRVVTGQTIRRAEGLILMRLLQPGVLYVMTVEAKRRNRLGQMKTVVEGQLGARLVRDMAGVAAHVERGVTASLLWNIHALVVAGEAEIVFLVARHRLQQLELVVGGMRIVAGQAIAHSGLVDRALDLGRILVCVTSQAELVRNGCGQLNASDIFINANFVAAQATSRDRRVNCLSFALVLVALQALRRVDIFVERNRMRLGRRWKNRNRQNVRDQEKQFGEGWLPGRDAFLESSDHDT